jgi:hypothetical protein
VLMRSDGTGALRSGSGECPGCVQPPWGGGKGGGHMAHHRGQGGSLAIPWAFFIESPRASLSTPLGFANHQLQRHPGPKCAAEARGVPWRCGGCEGVGRVSQRLEHRHGGRSRRSYTTGWPWPSSDRQGTG